MSSVSGLDQLCAAACNTGLDAPNSQRESEIRVVEIDAFASVADLIHAAISASGGSATLKEIYDVCERHGRIAYRRADGSRLITANDHWKSQVRHALYTGGRFERMASNAEFWQLSSAFANTPAELIRVLVRADDPTVHVRASLTVAPPPPVSIHTTTATTVAEMTANAPIRTIAPTATLNGNSHRNKSRRKRSANSAHGGPSNINTATTRHALNAVDDEGSAEDACDSADMHTTKNHRNTNKNKNTSSAYNLPPAPAPPPSRSQPMRKKRMQNALFDTNELDELSVLDEFDDDINDIPAIKSRGGVTSQSRHQYEHRPVNMVCDGIHSAATYATSENTFTCYEDRDPSGLQWGARAFRTTIIITHTPPPPAAATAANEHIFPITSGRYAHLGSGSDAAPGALPSSMNKNKSNSEGVFYRNHPITLLHHGRGTPKNNDNDTTTTTATTTATTTTRNNNNNNKNKKQKQRAGSAEADSLPSFAHHRHQNTSDAGIIADKKAGIDRITPAWPHPQDHTRVDAAACQNAADSTVNRSSPDFLAVNTPNDCKEAVAQPTPPFIDQWTHALQQFRGVGDPAVAAQMQAYLPGLLAAAAAPFLAGQQLDPQQVLNYQQQQVDQSAAAVAMTGLYDRSSRDGNSLQQQHHTHQYSDAGHK